MSARLGLAKRVLAPCVEVYKGYSYLIVGKGGTCGPVVKRLLEPALGSDGLVDYKAVACRTALVVGAGFALWFAPLYAAARVVRIGESRLVTPIVSRIYGPFVGSAVQNFVRALTHRYTLTALSAVAATLWTRVFVKELLKNSIEASKDAKILKTLRQLLLILEKDNAPQELLEQLDAIQSFSKTVSGEQIKLNLLMTATKFTTKFQEKQRDIVLFLLTPGKDQEEIVKKMVLLDILASSQLLQKDKFSEPEICGIFGSIQSEQAGKALIQVGFDIETKNPAEQTAAMFALKGWIEAPSPEKMAKVCRLIKLGAKVDLNQNVKIGEESQTYAEWLTQLKPTLIHAITRTSQSSYLFADLFPTKETMEAQIGRALLSYQKNQSAVVQTAQGLSFWEVILQSEQAAAQGVAEAFLNPLSPEQRAYYLPLTLAAGKHEYLEFFGKETQVEWFDCLTSFKNLETAGGFKNKLAGDSDSARACTNKDGISPLVYLAQKKSDDPLFSNFSKYNYIKALLDLELQDLKSKPNQNFLDALDKEADKDLITHIMNRK